MPTGTQADLDVIRRGLRQAFGADLREVVEKPVAFGVVALETMILLDDAGGLIEDSEKAIMALQGVSSVETLSVDLL